jgi:hypothetical protein
VPYDARNLAAVGLSASPARSDEYPALNATFAPRFLSSNVASRLCDEAKPGQILINSRVLTNVENAVTVEPVGEFALKGHLRPMSALPPKANID